MRWKIKRKATRALYGWACNGPAAGLGSSVLRAFGKRPLRVSKFEDAALPVATLAASSPYCVEAPRWNGADPLVRAGEFPPVKARVVRQATFMISSSALVQGDRLYLPDRVRTDRKRLTTASGNLFFADAKDAVGAASAQTKIENGIFIGGAGSFNWYHFVIECLPKAYLAQRLPVEFDHLPLLVPDECQRISSFIDALALFTKNREVRFLKPNYLYCNKELLIVDDVSIGPFNMVQGKWPQIDDYAQHDHELRSFIKAFRSELVPTDRRTTAGRRVFLKRPPKQRAYNQDEICAIAERYGFEPVSPETLTLREQAELFATADAVVGASGAAWVGMIFRERPMNGLSWLPSVYSEFCGYSSLARLMGHKLDFIEATPDRELESSGQSFTTGYTVCPIRFESAIQRTIASPDA